MKPFFLKYNNLTLDYIYTDKHLHTNWIHGKNSVIEIINKARQIGLNQIAITEHCRKSSTYYDDFYSESSDYRTKEVNMDILIGYEAKIYNYDGQVDVSYEIDKKADISIASVHNFPVGDKFYKPKLFEKELCQEIELRLSLAGLNNSNFDILGHPGGQSIKYYDQFPIEYFEEIIKSCKSNNIAFDLNYNYHFKHFEDIEPLLIKYNPYVSLGSDAHTLKYVGIWTKVKRLSSHI